MRKNNTLDSKKTKLIIGAIILAIVVIVLCIVLNNKKDNEDKNKSNISVSENGTINNISSKMMEKRTVEKTYEVTPKSLKYENGATKFVVSIKNVSGGNTNGKLTKIVFLDKNNNELSNMSLYIKAMTSNQEYETSATIGSNLVDAYDFKLVF